MTRVRGPIWMLLAATTLAGVLLLVSTLPMVIAIARLQERVHWGNTTATETLNMLAQKFQGMGDASPMAMRSCGR